MVTLVGEVYMISEVALFYDVVFCFFMREELAAPIVLVIKRHVYRFSYSHARSASQGSVLRKLLRTEPWPGRKWFLFPI